MLKKTKLLCCGLGMVLGLILDLPFGSALGLAPAKVHASGYPAEQSQTTAELPALQQSTEQAFIFTDIPVIPGNWKYESVKYVSERNIMSNISGTKLFDPDAPLTRDMFATVLYRMAGEPSISYTDKFQDVVPDKWYTKAILWASQEGIVNGYSNGSYGVGDKITREQISKMLCLFGEVQGYDTSARAEISSFTDVKNVSSWAVPYFQWSVEAGIIGGKPNGNGSFRLDPKEKATRAECAKMLMMFMQKYRDPSQESDINIDAVNFPDDSFRQYITKYIDKDHNGKLSDSERRKTCYINMLSWTPRISSLQGIEYFYNLIELLFSSHPVSSIDLSKNTALTILYCYNTQLTSLDLSNNTQLEELQCYNSQITDLDLSKASSLKKLSCYRNQLTTLDLTNNTELTHLSCSENQLTELDLSKHSALIFLDCFDNQLTELDLSSAAALTHLYCDNNQLTELDLSNNSALTYLSCSSNQLTTLDLSSAAALTDLHCFGNQLTELDLSNNSALTYLYCTSNQLTSLDLRNNTNLQYFNCDTDVHIIR